MIPFSVDLMQNYKIYEVAKNVVEVTIWDGPTWGVWISDKAWKKLTPEQQKIVMEVGEEVLPSATSKRCARRPPSRACSSRRKASNFIRSPGLELVKWRAALAQLLRRVRRQAGGAGQGCRCAQDGRDLEAGRRLAEDVITSPEIVLRG